MQCGIQGLSPINFIVTNVSSHDGGAWEANVVDILAYFFLVKGRALQPVVVFISLTLHSCNLAVYVPLMPNVSPSLCPFLFQDVTIQSLSYYRVLPPRNQSHLSSAWLITTQSVGLSRPVIPLLLFFQHIVGDPFFFAYSSHSPACCISLVNTPN